MRPTSITTFLFFSIVNACCISREDIFYFIFVSLLSLPELYSCRTLALGKKLEYSTHPEMYVLSHTLRSICLNHCIASAYIAVSILLVAVVLLVKDTTQCIQHLGIISRWLPFQDTEITFIVLMYSAVWSVNICLVFRITWYCNVSVSIHLGGNT